MENLIKHSKGTFTSLYKTLTSSVKSTFLICLMICFSSFLRGQQDSLWTAGNKMIDMDNETDFPVAEALPTSGDYDGSMNSQYATNVQYDEEGNLLFFIIDGRIYDEDGELIADSELDSNCQECLPKGMHDVSIVKRPETCDQYFIFWGHRPDPQSFNYGLEMAVLDLNVVSENGQDICGSEPSLVNWTELWANSGNGALESHPFYEFINQQYPDGTVTSDPDDPDVASDPIQADYSAYGSNVTAPLGPSASIGDYTITIPTPTESTVHTSRIDFDIVDGDLAGEKTLFVMTSRRLVVYKINSQGVFFEEDFTTPGNDFLSDEWAGGKRQYIGMEVMQKNGIFYVAIADDGGSTSMADNGEYDADDNNGRNLYFLTIDPQDYNILSQNKIDTHWQLEDGDIGDLAFSTEGDYLYFNTEYEIVENEAPYLYYLDIDELLNGTVTIGSVPTQGVLTDYERLRLASAQIMAHEYNDKPSIFYVNNDGSNGHLCVLEGSDDPTNSTFHHNEILLGPINASSVDGSAGFQDSNNNFLNFYTLNKQNFAPQQAEELAMEECCEWQDLNQNEVIEGYTTSADENWDADNNPFNTNGENTVTFCDDLVFEDGASIDITGMTLIFTEHANLIVERGAVLFLDGTTLTSLCDRMWPGVDLLGDPLVDQVPTLGGDQGYLSMENNSAIENAMTAVSIGQNDGFYPPVYYLTNNSGGVLRASNSTFRNNVIGIQMYPYANEDDYTGIESGNYTYLDDCLFYIDGDGLNNPSLTPQHHVGLYDVSGIRMHDCSFQNNAPYSMYAQEERGNGVVAGDGSTFEIEGNGTTTSFVGLYNGINALINGEYSCSEMIFDENFYGIHNTSTDRPEIFENEISIPDYDQKYGSKEPHGVFLANSTGYRVTRNEFAGEFDLPAEAVGCRVNNSGGDDNYIYKNNFKDLRYGTYVERRNRNGDKQTGLQVLCNNFSTGTLDIYVGFHSTWRDDQGGYQGQGLGSMKAGNEFSYASPNCSGGQFDVKIHANNSYTTDYHPHNDNNYIPDAYYYSACESVNNNNLQLLYVENPNGNPYEPGTCPTDFQGHDVGDHGGGGTVPEDVLVMQSGLDEIEDDIEETWNIYKQTVDKDSTEYLVDILNQAYSEESQYLRDLLLQKYPLSKEVLIKLIEEGENLDDWHLTQIMVANAPLEREIMHFLVESDLLSEFHLDFIRDADGGDNLRQVLETELSGLYQERNHLRNSMSRAYALTFTDNDLDLDSVTPIFNQEYEQLWSNYPNHLSRAKYFLRQHETNNALDVIDEIEDASERSYWQDFVAVTENLSTSGLDSNDVALFESRWNDAQNPLNTVYLASLHHHLETDEALDVETPSSTRSATMDHRDSNENSKTGFIEAHPNPANHEIFIKYPSDAEEMKATLQVRNLDGRLVKTIELNDQNGLVSIPTSDWSQGMYIISLIVNDKQMDTEKFTIIH